MDRAERAKIFMPFSALKGYYDLILAQEDGKEIKREVDEETATKISDKLNRVNKGSSIKNLSSQDLHAPFQISFTDFCVEKACRATAQLRLFALNSVKSI